ncbi:hypothetical protein Lcho_2267 [Leptothrix cholodnii SP-6]|uniref:Uncharacterized protein n=1 Tax=Leptothrix cholodnii (strain ATCC 51168 / LMG 8142 / SP-6) TaxID=395495 RepID=B1Y411_LEPCP|nr:hypothetical protein [Leptothrix cholodnii]ACB34533.1 hypothetical protein Lcho_2267 [Leptothrix cholodnii SP-6]
MTHHIPQRPSRRAIERVLAGICTSLVSTLAIVLGSCVAPQSAHAAEPVTVGLHLATAHTAGGYNPVNPGLYIRTARGLTLGIYRNSMRATSAYAAYTHEWLGGHLALTAGAVTGYAALPVAPLLVPSVRLDLVDGFSARLAYLPKPPHYGGSAGLHLSVERSF